VITVALNLARSGLRRLRSERRARARLHASVVGEPPTADRLDADRALAALPRRQREVAVLRYYLQLSTREVAAALELDEGTVKSTLFRARAALARALGIDENEEANDRGPR
jgi:RNA polymerase sigma factor (sigma-70 family)